jgi:hypothetical protein
VIKEKVKERYGSIVQTGTFESVCATTECCCSSEVFSAVQMAKNIGYHAKELIATIRKAGFNSLQVLQEATYLEDGRLIISLVAKAIK